ncbi:hypothetical protein V1280_008873 [Bradyrhizobium sp. AZCC 2230]
MCSRAAGSWWTWTWKSSLTFDRVDHDILIDRLQKRIGDAGVIRLIRAYLNSGIMDDGVVQKRTMGTPQGGPLSPLLANVLLDEVDRALERRGHCFVRYADDANVYMRSRRAGERVMALLRRLYGKLRLTVNETKSAVTGVFGRKFLGYGFWVAPGGVIKRKVPAAQVGAVCKMWWSACGPMFGDGRHTSDWRKRRRSGESSTSGCVIGCAPSSSSSGSAARPCTGNCWQWEPSRTWRDRWRPTAVAGGNSGMLQPRQRQSSVFLVGLFQALSRSILFWDHNPFNPLQVLGKPRYPPVRSLGPLRLRSTLTFRQFPPFR